MKKYISIIFIFFMAILSCQKEPQAVKVSSVSLDISSLELTISETAKVVATVLPDNADNQKVIWSTSNASVITVSNGTITAVGAGSASVIVTTDDGGKTAVCKVDVKEQVYPVTEVKFDVNELSLTEGESDYIVATINPSNATNKNLIWTSSNTDVATVQNGKITAIKKGETVITAKSEDGDKTATCNVTVKAKVYAVTGVSLNKTSVELTEGDTETLTATISPSNASNKKVSWTSSNNSVATVADGKITAVKPGSATITVKTEDGGKIATCKVTVKAKVYAVTGVSLNKTSVELTEGDTETLSATISPSNATNKNLIWTSSNSSVATVSNGKVTALKAGSATITVKTEDGGKTATCSVTVKQKVYNVTGIYLNYESLFMMEGDTETLVATIIPDDAANKNVTWLSSDPSVATVSSTGVVKAIKLGTATITAKSQDGGYTARCNVTVTDISAFVTAGFASLSVSSGSVSYGNYICMTPGVTLGVAITNRSDKTIHITKMQLLCSLTSAGSSWDLDQDLEGGYRITWNITLRNTFYSPIIEFTYDYNGKQYVVRKTFTGSIGVKSDSVETAPGVITKTLPLPREVKDIR